MINNLAINYRSLARMLFPDVRNIVSNFVDLSCERGPHEVSVVQVWKAWRSSLGH